MTITPSGSETSSSAGVRSSQGYSGWGQSEFCKVNSGWGQESSQAFAPGDRRTNLESSDNNWNDFSGPIETWSNYRAISGPEWELFKEHQVVYSDGKNVEGVDPGWLVCGLCQYKKTLNKDLMHAHIESAKHKRNFEWFQSEKGSASLTDQDKRLLEAHKCVLQDTWIVCTLCDRKMMDMTYVPDHIAGRKHLNNLEWARSAGVLDLEEESSSSCLPEGIEQRGRQDYYCVACDASMTRKCLVTLHAESVRHQRNIGRDNLASTNLLQGFDVPIRRGPTILQLRQRREPEESTGRGWKGPRKESIIENRTRPLLREEVVRQVVYPGEKNRGNSPPSLPDNSIDI